MGVISDNSGVLQFYTDGFTVWNKRHARMPNGANLIEFHGRGSLQQSLVVPKPGSTSRYYIFTVDPASNAPGLYYSEVDMTLNSGLGDVVVKGVRLVKNTSNKLSAVFHRNGKDVWLITHLVNSNKYSLLRITDQGISAEITEQVIGSINTAWGGQLKFSPDGRKMGVICNDFVSLFDFNNETGVLSNTMNFSFADLDSDPLVSSLEFSSDATKLYTYVSRRLQIFQFDVSLPTQAQINKSRAAVSGSNIYNLLGAFQLAPDGRIYITKGGGGGGSDYLGVIMNPNAAGKDVEFQENGLYLNGGESFVNLTPSFIQNYFFKTSFKYDHHCQGVPIKFSVTNEHLIDSVKWDFGQGSTSRSRNPEVQYDKDGEYTVTLSAYYGAQATVITQQVSIWAYTPFELGEAFTTCPANKLTVDAGYASYTWNTGDTTRTTVLNATQWYKLKAINMIGCAYSDSVFVTVKDAPTIALPDRIAFSGHSSVQLDAGAFSSYAWSTGETTRTITVTSPGWYSVSVQNAVGCSVAKTVFVGDVAPEPPAEEWEWLNPLPSGRSVRDICFVNDNTGFIVNGYQILRTTDGGKTWGVQQNAQGNRIAFKDQIGYVVGDNGSVYKSTHQGGGWTRVFFGASDNLNGVSVIHPDTVFVTSGSQLFVTYDGGKSWTPRAVPGVAVVASVFTSSKTGHVAGSNGILAKTTDGGLTWRIVHNDSNISPSNFFALTFVNSKVGYATQAHSNIYKTTNGGETWEELPWVPDAAYDVFFLNERVGYIAGDGGVVHKTENGGMSWEWAGFLNGRYYAEAMNALYFFDEDNGFAVGFRGRIMRTYNGGQQWQSYGMSYNDIQEVTFPSATTGYALGDRIYKTTDQGKTWLPVVNNLIDKNWYYMSGYFLSENKGYVVANNNYTTKVMQTADGGKTWGDAAVSGRVISFIDDQKGFIGGAGIYKTLNGGTSWENVSYFEVTELHFISEQRGFALHYGDLYKTIDGGKSWALVYEVYGDLTEIDFVNDKVGYISAEFGLVLKTTDGGETWMEKSTPYDHLLAIDFTSENIGFAAGEYGLNLMTSDGGNTWTSYSIPAQIRTVSIHGDKIFVGGYYGALLSKGFKVDDVTVKALAATAITANSAVLHGVIASNATVAQNARIEYGLTPAFANAAALTPGSVTTGKNVEYAFPASGLLPDTTYYYRLTTTVNGTLLVSNTIQFDTPPEVVLGPPNVGYPETTTAQVWAYVKSNMSAITNLQFEYDTVATFKNKKVVHADPADIAAGEEKYAELVLEGLRPKTEYYIRLKGTHNGKVYVSQATRFKTRAEFEITFGRVSANGSEVTLYAQVLSNEHALTALRFEYGLSQTYGSMATPTPSEVGGRSWAQLYATITVPYVDSVYYYRVIGLYNGKAFASDYNVFRLSGGVILVADPAKNVSSTGVDIGGLVRLQGSYLSNLVFEYGTTRDFGETAPVNGYSYYNDYSNVTTTLEGLADDTEYFYRLRATVWNGFQYSDARTFRTSIVTGIADAREDELNVYPNPAERDVTLVSSRRMERVEVLDAMARPILVVPASGFSCTFPVSELSPGIYYIRIIHNGATVVRKLVRK
ncbi:YCF48-related protein [Parachryseolinea silvisoli]|uniref:YCF48-related protein n=1 Tax=Parachryseolinea silvisoli TaxID=2873601 RepID=UPI002265BCAE|nr:YCF48-related protein [Parachryseolinea silvisoli]MCD9017625.1 T9SS type A sorting domain-containing protein [Parachryseolinea silvisoli]